MSFHSQFGEDEWIANNLSLPEKGFFLDVGCAHPTEHSNTAFLRERGWTGIAVDGNGAWGAEWKKEEQPGSIFVNAIISDKQKSVRFNVNQCAHWSRIESHDGSDVAISLDDLLFATCFNQKIDFLSLDLEGGEYDALMGLSRELWPPIIVSEFSTILIGEDFRVRDCLVEAGYKAVHQSEANIIFHRP